MVQLTDLNWFFRHLLPFLTEVPIVHIDNRLSDQIISKLFVIVNHFDFQARSARESDLELEHSVELWIGFIFKVKVSFVNYGLTTSDTKVGV